MMPICIARARAVPILGELQRRGIKLPKRAGAEASGPCPICGGTDRFWVNTRRSIWGCRGCGKSGEDIIELVRHLDGVDFQVAVATLTEGTAAGHSASPVRVSAQETPKQGQDNWGQRHALKLWREAVAIEHRHADVVAVGPAFLQSPLSDGVRHVERQRLFGEDFLCDSRNGCDRGRKRQGKDEASEGHIEIPVVGEHGSDQGHSRCRSRGQCADTAGPDSAPHGGLRKKKLR